jgi:tetratricopeptide (TPR) repeat protein
LASTWLLLGWLVLTAGNLGRSAGFAPDRFNWRSYSATEPGVIAHYLRLAVWPSGLCLDYGWPAARTWGDVLVPGIPIAVVLALTVWALVKWPAWGLLGASFFAILAPTSSFFPVLDAAFEHRMYLPLAAVVTALVTGSFVIGRWIARRAKIPLLVSQSIGGCLVLLAGVALIALTLRRNMDYQDDLSLWEDTVAKAPHNPRAHTSMGLALAAHERLDEAIAEYHQALDIKPDFFKADVNLGVVLRDEGRLPEAISHLERALKAEPDVAQIHYNLALALVDAGRIDEASAHFAKARQLQPDYANAQAGQGIALYHQGQTEQAIAYYRKALAINPRDAELHYNLSNALTKQGRLDEALDECRKALEIKPAFVEALNNYGALLSNRGQVDEAIRYFQQALKLNSRHASSHFNLASALAKRARYDAALAEYAKGLKLKPDYVEGRNNLGLLLAARGRDDEAIAHFQEALELKPDMANTRRNLALVLSQQGRIPEAIAQWREVIRLQPQSAVALSQLARLLATTPDASLRNASEAVELAGQAAKLSGGRDPNVLDALAAAYAEAGRFGEAVETARQALTLAEAKKNTALAEALRARIKLYQAGSPYREGHQPSNPPADHPP